MRPEALDRAITAQLLSAPSSPLLVGGAELTPCDRPMTDAPLRRTNLIPRAPHINPSPCMPMQRAAVLRAPADLTASRRGIDETLALLKRLFRHVDDCFGLRLWDGSSAVLGRNVAACATPRFTLVFRNPDIIRSLIFGRDPLRLAEA